MTRFCKDCKFYQAHETAEQDRCLHPKAEIPGSPHVVRGEGQSYNYKCTDIRGTFCLGAKLFEPRPCDVCGKAVCICHAEPPADDSAQRERDSENRHNDPRRMS